jgi:hypothetical protein
MGQLASAAQRLRIVLRHSPIADVLPVIVGAQPVGLLQSTQPLTAPQTIRPLLDGGHQIPVGQVGERAPAIQTADVFKENQMLTVSTVESFHVFKGPGLRAPLRPQGSVCFPVRKSRA